MTQILCRWLNDELNLSRRVEPENFTREFATGYLIGEVLRKYELQDDFDQFSQSKNTDSRLNNFTRLEPVLHLLGIPFDTNIARDIMTEKHGNATTLMYQLFIALNNKTKFNLTGVAIETMRPRAPVILESMERPIYIERLKKQIPRQTDLDLEELAEKFRDKKKQHTEVEFRARYEAEENLRQWQQQQRQLGLEKARQQTMERTEMVARIKAAAVHIPQPPPNRTLAAISLRGRLNKQREAEDTQRQIAEFEDKLKSVVPPSGDEMELDEDLTQYIREEAERPTSEQIELIKPASNDEYIGKIRKRLQEDSVAREEREKRRRKVLVDQLQAHAAQEEARREEMLVNHLMRQSQQERRIAVQLLQARHEKEIIRQNRIFREKQYEERRMKDFLDSLDREAELASLAKLEYMEQTMKDKELHDRIAAERAEAKYKKHYDICMEILVQIVDFSCKVGEYRELTDKLLPEKLMREWTLLFTEEKPIYEESTEERPEELTEEEKAVEEERQLLLDEGDFLEYKNMVGEWEPPEECDFKEPPKNNAILGHIIKRLFDIVHPPSPPPPAPEFAAFPIKACFLGKLFSGKTTALQKLASERGVEVLNIDKLVAEAIDAFKNGEVLELPDPNAPVEAEEAGGDAQPGDGTSAQEINVIPPTPSAADGQPLLTDQEQPPPPPQEDSNKLEEKAVEDKEKESEKSDPEKKEGEGQEGAVPVEAKEGSETPTTPSTPAKSGKKTPKKKGPPKPEFTPRAKLGKKASIFLRKGQPIKDELMVDIMVEAVRRVQEGRGWIMDGFPATITQAKLLEKALSGYDVSARPSRSQTKKSRLAQDPHPAKEAPPPTSAIDVVVLFDIPDEIALRRAAGRTYAVQGEEEYQQEFKPPPEGSITGIGKKKKVPTATLR